MRGSPSSDDTRPHVWIFHGEEAAFTSGVFASKEQGLDWAAANRQTGTLSEYALGVGTYDDAIASGRFRPSKPHHGTPKHVAGFSPQYEHLHLIDGVPA